MERKWEKGSEGGVYNVSSRPNKRATNFAQEEGGGGARERRKTEQLKVPIVNKISVILIRRSACKDKLQ